MPPPSKKLDLNLECEIDVLTPGATAEIVNTLLEFLLYQRNQIPFVYKTYKYYVNRWAEDDDEEKEDDKQNEITQPTLMQSFQLQRQRGLATQTKEAISIMRELIAKSFQLHTIKCIRFLFGATAFTPKESYTIHIPTAAISKKHSHAHHLMPKSRLNQTLISLLTSAELYTTFSHNLSPTNLYLELEMLDNHHKSMHTINDETHSAFPKDFCQLPSSCKDIHLHLLHKPQRSDVEDAATMLQCCREMQVFVEDMARLNLDAECSEQEEKPNKSALEACETVWWEADIVVRGFKEQAVRGGHSMWKK